MTGEASEKITEPSDDERFTFRPGRAPDAPETVPNTDVPESGGTIEGFTPIDTLVTASGAYDSAVEADTPPEVAVIEAVPDPADPDTVAVVEKFPEASVVNVVRARVTFASDDDNTTD
ncbi:hypothetical protein HR12_34855 [Microbacterium sp. SUBG005]|nr:hypothetical protein HR12_34855 [Microbacterium sp. SUBG005]